VSERACSSFLSAWGGNGHSDSETSAGNGHSDDETARRNGMRRDNGDERSENETRFTGNGHSNSETKRINNNNNKKQNEVLEYAGVYRRDTTVRRIQYGCAIENDEKKDENEAKMKRR
jgi:hypothetical protein